MLEFQRNSKRQHWLYSKGVLVVLLIIIIYLVKGVFGLYVKAQTSMEARKVSEGELKELSERRSFIDGEIGRLHSEEGIEREIREKFSVAKPGEEMVILVAAAIDPTPEPKKSIFNRIWDRTKKFFGTTTDDVLE